MPRVAFQGEPGAFSEEAIRRAFDGRATAVPCREFHDVGQAVRSGAADHAMLPIENAIAGTVVASYDVLIADTLQAVGEIVVPVHLCVLGLPGATLDRARRVVSHPVALAQCTRFLRQSGLEAVAALDTAGAARQVACEDDRTVTALASRAAAERYGLRVLAADVQDRPDNLTRFLLLTRPGTGRPETPRAEPGTAEKSLLLADIPNRPGGLAGVLEPFAAAGVNLAGIQTRPGSEPWTYRFFLEIEADYRDPALAAVREAVERAARAIRLIGCYSRLGSDRRAG